MAHKRSEVQHRRVAITDPRAAPHCIVPSPAVLNQVRQILRCVRITPKRDDRQNIQGIRKGNAFYKAPSPEC